MKQLTHNAKKIKRKNLTKIGGGEDLEGDSKATGTTGKTGVTSNRTISKKTISRYFRAGRNTTQQTS